MFCAFVDLEKAYDRIPREIAYWCLRKRGIPEALVEIIKEMYEGAEAMVRNTKGKSESFEIRVGLQEGSALSPLLFIIVIDVITDSIRDPRAWEMLFADDLGIVQDTEGKLQEQVVCWQRSLESKGLKVNVEESEVMVAARTRCGIKIVDRNGQELKQVSEFKYLGSVFEEDGRCEADVKERIRAGWSKWKEVNGVINNSRMPLKLKLKVYESMVRPAIMYGSECWTLRKKEEQLLERTEMRMLRRILGVTLRDKIRNEEIRRRTRVTSIVKKVKIGRLRWFGHVVRREDYQVVKRAWKEPVRGSRGRGRPRIRWYDEIKQDLVEREIKEEDARNRRKWRKLIHDADP